MFGQVQQTKIGHVHFFFFQKIGLTDYKCITYFFFIGMNLNDVSGQISWDGEGGRWEWRGNDIIYNLLTFKFGKIIFEKKVKVKI